MNKLSSIRALVTVMVSATFCYLAVVRAIDAKDVLLITSLVFNFYFLVKKRDYEETKPEIKP